MSSIEPLGETPGDHKAALGCSNVGQRQDRVDRLLTRRFDERTRIDDHQIGGHRLAAGLHHMAGAVLGAFRAQAVVARAGHERDHRRAFVQAFHFGKVAAARARVPKTRK